MEQLDEINAENKEPLNSMNVLETVNKLLATTNSGGVAVWIWDIVKNELIWDDQMFKLYGINRDQFGSTYESWQNGLHPGDVERCNAEVQDALNGTKDFATEFRVVWPDSSIHYIRALGKVERDADGKPLRFTGTNIDITTFSQTEETLKNSIKEISDYKYALDESCIVAITDQKGIITRVNDNFCKISKYSREELIGQDHRIINSGHHPKEFIRDLWTTIANGKVWRGELKNKAKDGTFYWVDTTIIPFLNKQHKPYQYLAIRADITSRKEAEENILSLNKELESFSYSVSHDLRAPIRSINGYAKMLQEDYASKLDDEAIRLSSQITNYAAKMGHLIDDLLAYSRIGRKELVKNNIDMNNMVAEVFREILTDQKNQAIELKVTHLLPALGDPAVIKQVWVNLISNAVKYTGKKEKPVIEIRSENKANEVVYSVCDNGVGFDMQFADKLFGVFQRLHSEEEFEGTGVGLAIVHRIITKHGGKVWADAGINEGATFYFTLNKV